MSEPSHNRAHPVIGVDFDNTLVIYDHLFHRVAIQEGLVGPSVQKTKKHVRDALRALPDGEIAWQRLQGLVYGSRMSEAKLAEGVPDFFRACGRRSTQLYIISHKTQFASYDPTQADLRESAMAWMTQNGFFDPHGFGISPGNVFFEETRREKLRRIEDLGCTHFVDDLEEVFSEELFPHGVCKILYAPSQSSRLLRDVAVAESWAEVATYVLGGED